MQVLMVDLPYLSMHVVAQLSMPQELSSQVAVEVVNSVLLT